MFSTIIKVSDSLNIIFEKITIIIFALITVLTFSGVISRYIFGSPIIWLYETTLVLFSWVTFMGISIAFKRNEHIYLDFIFHKVSYKTGERIKITIKIITILFLIVVFKDSIEIIMETFGQYYNTINISTGWFYLPLLICSSVSIIHLLSQLFENKKRSV